MDKTSGTGKKGGSFGPRSGANSAEIAQLEKVKAAEELFDEVNTDGDEYSSSAAPHLTYSIMD
eukprot:2341598-Rhodomonas_salina.2